MTECGCEASEVLRLFAFIRTFLLCLSSLHCSGFRASREGARTYYFQTELSDEMMRCVCACVCVCVCACACVCVCNVEIPVTQ